ncbi:unnamed protein product [Amaranthus hypochondriacus]
MATWQGIVLKLADFGQAFLCKVHWVNQPFEVVVDLLAFCSRSRLAQQRKRSRMSSTFNPQILVEKLAKLNNSQQSIETLSHWCIFHMNKAKLVVETWEHQFHNSPREQRLAFLYLANDILQNSRRKGAEFVAEFWRVLPEALRVVIRNGDDFEKNAALRLISIWDERKVFGSRGHTLKEEFMGRQPENNVTPNKNGKQLTTKLRQSAGNMLDKIVSDYETIYGGQVDEDSLLSRCRNTNNCLEKVIKDIGGGVNSGNFGGSAFAAELKVQHAALRECIGQLITLESSRASLVSHLRDALQEQESKLDQVRSQLQAAQLRSDQVANVYRQFGSNNLLDEQTTKDNHASMVLPGQGNPVVYTRQVPVPDKSASSEDESLKSAAAAVAAKLTASSSSAEMFSHVLTSLVSGVTFGNNNNAKNSSTDPHHSEKRPKLDNEESSSYAPPPLPPLPLDQQPPPPLPPFPHPDHFIQTATNFSYGATQPSPSPPLSGYPSVSITGMSPYAAPPVNPYQPFPGSEGGFYSPSSSSVPMAPSSRQ